MGKLLLGIISLAFLGCTGIQTPQIVYNQPCTIYEDIGATPENSLVMAKISNPCLVHRLLVTAAKIPVVWGEQKYVEEFDTWANRIQGVIETGLSYKDLQDLIILEVAQFNKKAGLALLIIGDGVFVFDETEIIRPMDKKLFLMSLVDLRQQVAKLGILGFRD